MSEEECTEFIAAIPTVWDETVALGGEIAKYVATARRSGDEWYVGAMTNWDAREITLDLSFLGEGGGFVAEIYRDGVNAGKAARDYKKEIVDILSDRRLTVTMAPGGGFAAKIYKSGNLELTISDFE
jgi:alpha-glucosidase